MICLHLNWCEHWIVDNHLVWPDWPRNRQSKVTTCRGNNSKVASNQTQGIFQLTGFLTNKKSPKKSSASSILHGALRCWVPHSTQLPPNAAGPSFPELVQDHSAHFQVLHGLPVLSSEHHSGLCTLLLLSYRFPSTDCQPSQKLKGNK